LLLWNQVERARRNEMVFFEFKRVVARRDPSTSPGMTVYSTPDAL